MWRVSCVGALALLAVTSACQDFADDFKQLPPPSEHPFADDLSPPVGCAPTDPRCTGGGTNPFVQAPPPSVR